MAKIASRLMTGRKLREFLPELNEQNGEVSYPGGGFSPADQQSNLIAFRR